MQSRNTTIGRILFNVDLCNLYRLTIVTIIHNLYLVVKSEDGFVLCVIIVDLVFLVCLVYLVSLVCLVFLVDLVYLVNSAHSILQRSMSSVRHEAWRT